MIRVSILSVLLLWPAMALPQGLSYADRSGTITTGGTAQVALPAWSGRHGCVIQNQSTGSLWVSETATAISGGLTTSGYIRRVRYWPRALTNTELQSVTT